MSAAAARAQTTALSEIRACARSSARGHRGYPHRDHAILEAESDEEVMRAVKARWSRDEVGAVRWDDGRGQQRRVWIRL